MFFDFILNLFDKKRAVGLKGEKLTADILKHYNAYGKILKNVYVPTFNNGTTEIDMLYITQKGIFVVECKNYSGIVTGKIKDNEWTQSFPNGTVRNFYNPVMQNETHIKFLKKYLNDKIPLFSLIVFSEKCTLKNFRQSKHTFIIRRDELAETLNQIFRNNNDVLSKSNIKSILSELKPLTKVKNSVKKAHIENIKAKHKN